jgi:hypothetical protein
LLKSLFRKRLIRGQKERGFASAREVEAGVTREFLVDILDEVIVHELTLFERERIFLAVGIEDGE